MAFKKMAEINEKKNRNKLVLEDGETVKGIFLYNDYRDVLQCDCHYLQSPEYNGYVHCLEENCPICAVNKTGEKNIRKQSKIFVPFLVIAELNEKYDENEVLFWDRGNYIDRQIQTDVFKNFPNPMNYIFSITRHGAYKDRNTRYVIDVVTANKTDMNALLDSMGVKFPDYYDKICQEFNPIELKEMLDSGEKDSSSSYVAAPEFSYEVKPRRVVDPSEVVGDIELPENNAEKVLESIISEDVVSDSDDDNEPDF